MMMSKETLNRSSLNISSPGVSIIVPTYNRGKFIVDMIESVNSQTYKDWELIIIDDGSTDGTESIVKPYVCDKIKYQKLEHKGRSFARNYGLELANGSFIAYLDSDDLFLPSKLETQVNWLLEHPTTAMVYTSAIIFNDNTEEEIGCFFASASGHIYEAVSMYIPVTITLPSVMIRKEIQDEIGGFDENLDRFEDTDMWRRVSKKFIIDAIAEPLIKVRTHNDNSLNSLDPVKLLLDVRKYIQKALSEDRSEYHDFLNNAAVKLLFHYGIFVSTVPGWENKKWMYFWEALAYRPIYTIGKVVKMMTMNLFTDGKKIKLHIKKAKNH